MATKEELQKELEAATKVAGDTGYALDLVAKAVLPDAFNEEGEGEYTLDDVVGAVNGLATRPPKPQRENGAEPSGPGQYTEIQHVVRNIGTASTETTMTGPQTSAYIESYFKDGWTLFSTHYLGINDNGHSMMWILVR